MNQLKSSYNFLGYQQTAILLGFISGYIFGIANAPGLILPFVFGLFVAVFTAVIANLINWVLPEKFKPIYGIFQLAALIIHITILVGVVKITAFVQKMAIAKTL